MAVQEKGICLVYCALGLWDREASALEEQTKTTLEQIVLYVTLPYTYLNDHSAWSCFAPNNINFTRISQKSKAQMGRISLAPQRTNLLVQKQVRGVCIAWERWHQKVKQHQTLIRQTKPKPEQFQLGPNRQNWKTQLPGQNPPMEALELQETGTKNLWGLVWRGRYPLSPFLNNGVYLA